MSYRPQNVSAVLARGMLMLAKSSDSPRLDAQLLLAHVTGESREWLIAHGDGFMSKPQVDRFMALCEKRVLGMPLAYITGFAGFFGREFSVNDQVLIPRPETEHLVEDAIAHLRAKIDPHAPSKQLFTVLDVGTGSGAIACTIAAEVPGAIVEGTDTSAAALKAAEYNARRFNVIARCKFHYADIIRANDTKSYDLVAANLPYIPTAQIPGKPDPVGYEPREALDGGPDGLTHYRKLLAQAPQLLRPGALLLMEAAPPTIGDLLALTREALPGANVEVRQDYGLRDRYIYAKKT